MTWYIKLLLLLLSHFSRVRLLATPWTAAYQAPPAMGSSRQEYWSGVPLPSPDGLPNPGIEPGSPALSVQFSSVTQSCPTLCNSMNRSTLGLPVHHQLPELTQTHVHRVSDAIQPSHPLSSPSPTLTLECYFILLWLLVLNLLIDHFNRPKIVSRHYSLQHFRHQIPIPYWSQSKHYDQSNWLHIQIYFPQHQHCS